VEHPKDSTNVGLLINEPPGHGRVALRLIDRKAPVLRKASNAL
jgi:hypothetical protein